MTAVDRTAEPDDVFAARIAPFEAFRKKPIEEAT